MDKLLSVLFNLEVLIRNLLSGSFAVLLLLASIKNPEFFIGKILDNKIPSAVFIVFIGFVVYSFYRVFAWAVFDHLAFNLGWSVPSEFRNKDDDSFSYPRPYAKFLRWRHSVSLKKSLSDYLTARWSIVHFCLIASSLGFTATFMAAPESFLSSVIGKEVSYLILFVIFSLSAYQLHFLFCVERDLYRIEQAEAEDGG